MNPQSQARAIVGQAADPAGAGMNLDPERRQIQGCRRPRGRGDEPLTE